MIEPDSLRPSPSLGTAVIQPLTHLPQIQFVREYTSARIWN